MFFLVKLQKIELKREMRVNKKNYLLRQNWKKTKPKYFTKLSY